MQQFILNNGYLAVFLLMVAESACIPVPSEVTMLFGGALANATFVAGLAAGHTHLNFVVVALLGTLGNLVGSWIAYGVGYRGGRPLLDRWTARAPGTEPLLWRLLRLRPDHVERADRWFADHGEAAVFVSRLLPVVRTFISLPAGVARMRFDRFSAYTLAGCLPWTFALAAAGYGLGSQWHTVDHWLRPLSILVALVLVAAAVWWVVRQRRSAGAATPAPTDV
ncbi:MAG: DedA family protein [Acidimicrobiales bacterium]